MTAENIKMEIKNKIEDLEKIEKISINLIRLSARLGLVTRSEASELTKKIVKEVELEERVLQNFLDMDPDRLGTQAARNYSQVIEMSQGEIRENSYVWQLQEAATDLEKILNRLGDQITEEQEKIAKLLKQDMRDLRLTHRQFTRNTDINELEKHLKPSKIREDVKNKEPDALSDDLEGEVSTELRSMIDIYHRIEALEEKISKILKHLEQDEEELQNCIEKAKSNGESVEEISHLIRLTRNSRDKLRDTSEMTSETGKNIREVVEEYSQKD